MRSFAPFSIRKLLVAASAVALLGGCGTGQGGTSTVRGKVTDGSGSQSRWATVAQHAFGGQGTLSAASSVKISALQADGSMSLLATAQLQEDGSWSASVPANQTRLIAQAVDGSGNVVASAIIETSASAGGTEVAPPMTTETSVEAQVLARMVADGVPLTEANAVDVRARIDAKIAAAVQADAASSAQASSDIEALASSIAAAEQTEVSAYADDGVQITQSQLFQAELSAAQALNVALDGAGSAGASDAYSTFFASLRAAAQSQGATPQEHAKAESCASVSFRATLKARAQSSTVVQAGIRAAALLESRSSGAAVQAVLSAGANADAAEQQAISATEQLQTNIQGATDTSTVISAFSTFQADVAGQSDLSSSVLGIYLGVNGTGDTSVQAAVKATTDSTAQTSSALNATLSTLITTAGAVDFQAVATTVVQGYDTIETSAQAQEGAFTSFTSSADVAVDLLIVANGSFLVAG